ncbi:N-acetylmuramoyl-L-alanine amidase [Micrococcus sp. IITD107]|uniref:N-acetylmuramoyl-L-alanine amidase n=1 Tax=Micrococcus sp. IITD107 TaxID=3342790 RepID=UPI0035BB9527
MSRDAHPALHRGLAAALSVIVATTVLPAAVAAPAPTETAAAAAVASSPSEEALVGDPGGQGQSASAVTGQQDQTVALAGIAPEAVPEAAPELAARATEGVESPSIDAVPEAEDLTASSLADAIDAPAGDPAQVAVLTDPVETIDFVVGGVTWDISGAGQVTDVSVRVREDAEWTEWTSLEIHDGNERPGLTRVGTEPLVSSGGDAVQVRVSTVDGEVPEGLDLQLIDPGTAATDGQLAPASPASPHLEGIEDRAGQAQTASAATAQQTGEEPVRAVLASHTVQPLATTTNHESVLKPAIVTREQWGADESITLDWGSPSKDLKAMYIHHTAGSNNYTRAGAYEQIRGIHRYHAATLGWGDIGYQFLVDRYGVIYEGRRGAIEAPVIGAQAGGFNTDTIGVSGMGRFDYSSAGAAPPTAMVDAMKRVLAWQAYRYDVDPTAKVVLTQSGKGTARWTSGTQVTVHTILGHSTTNATECPGPYLEAQLPQIRSSVGATVDAAIRTHGEYRPPGQVQIPGMVTPVSQVWESERLTVTWLPGEGAERYVVRRRVAPAGTSDYGPWERTATLGGDWVRGRFDVAEGTRTQWSLQSQNAAGVSKTKVIATHDRPERLQPPGMVTPRDQVWESGRLTVTWLPGEGAERYVVRRRVAPAGTSDYGPWERTATLGGDWVRGRFDVAEGTRTQWSLQSQNAAGVSKTKVIATHTR